MNDAVLQVLLILAFLAIGLISVTFPIFAVSVNFLRQQKWESEKERKKRQDELEAKISELTSQLGKGADTGAIKEQLDRYETEKKGRNLRYKYLTAKGAVGVPISILVISLLFACFGTYAFYKDSKEGAIVLGGLSALFSISAIYRLYKTLSAVEYGALKPERTVEFQVGFGTTREKTKVVKRNQEMNDGIYVKTDECDNESVAIYAKFPAELGVADKYAETSAIRFTEHETYSTVYCYRDYLPKGRGIGIPFVGTPSKVGKFSIEVRVFARGIYENLHELIIEVK